MTTWTPLRYPNGHPQAGAIIVDPEQDVLATLDLMAEPPDPDVERIAAEPVVSPKAVVDPTAQRPLSALLPGAEAAQEEKAPPRPAYGVVAALVVLGLLLVGLWSATRPVAAPVVPAAPTAPARAEATPAATSGPTLTAMPPNTAPRALVAYFDYGNPATATAIERDTPYTPVGRIGQHWLLVELDGGGRVWAYAEDLGATVDPALPDLATPPPAPPAAPAARPAVPAAPASAPSCAWVEVTRDVHNSAGLKLGYVVAGGCGQAEAEANAQKEAETMRAGR